MEKSAEKTKDICISEEEIQAFLDGELSDDKMEFVARRVAACECCALALERAEEEWATAYNLLDEEFNPLVPTERLRTNIYRAISEIEEPKSLRTRVFGRFSPFAPTMVAFASLLVVFGVSLSVFSPKDSFETSGNETAKSETFSPAVKPAGVQENRPSIEPAVASPKILVKRAERPRVEKISYRIEPSVSTVEPRQAKYQSLRLTSAAKENATQAPSGNFAGEDSYLKAIAELETSVKDKKDGALGASSRFSFERDMAITENSIKAMKAEIRKNPRNEAAKKILRNSYQNKIDLLNSVAERSEITASLE